MKSNQKFKSLDDVCGAVSIVSAVIALLLMIIVGVMLFFTIYDSMDMNGAATETFTGYSSSANASAWSITLDNSPTSSSAVNITCTNTTGPSSSYPAFTLSHKTITVAADAANEFNTVTVVYTSNKVDSAGDTGDMASTVFGLLPIVALAVIASLIIGVIMGFGRSGSGI